MKIAQGQTALITGAASGIGMFIFALPYLQIYRVLLLKDAGNMQATSLSFASSSGSQCYIVIIFPGK